LSQNILRSGITTGSCAAAAAKAAVLAWLGTPSTTVEVTTPQGQSICIPVASSMANAHGGMASIVKDAGDDPDITNGVTITAVVTIGDVPGIIINAGAGVGRVTKPGLTIPVGEPAINPGPRRMIILAMEEVLPPGKGVAVTISIPEGDKLAEHTLNPVLGIIGGLSILGTTGIVEPMSEEAYKSSLVPQISVVQALGFDKIVFVPGKIGQNIAVNRFGLPAELTVQTSNFVGYMLENAVRCGIREVLLFGHIGKIVKVAAGIFHTHNRVADARMETLAAYAAAHGAQPQTVRDILACVTTEAAMPIVEENGLMEIYQALAGRASERAKRYVFGELSIGTAIVTMDGKLLGMDDGAREIGGKMGWSIK